MRPPRLLVVGHSADHSGAPVALLRSMRSLVDQGVVEPIFLLRHGGPLIKLYRELGEVAVLEINREDRLRRVSDMVGARRASDAILSLGLGAWLRSRCKAWRVEAIYLNTITHGDLAEALSPLRLPIICHVHEMSRFVARNVSAAQLSCLIDSVSRWIAVSTPVSEMIVTHGVHRNEITVVPPSVELPEPLLKDERAELRSCYLEVSKTAKIVAGCGLPTWTKGPELFLQLALRLKQLQQNQPEPIIAVWIGADRRHPDTIAMQEDAYQMNLNDNVRILDFLPNAARLLGAADVVVSTSREDANPLVILEAAAAGRPVVCFEGAGGANDVVRAGGGLMAPYLDVEKMASAVCQLAGDAGRSEDLGRAGRRYVATRATTAVTTPEIARVITEALEDRVSNKHPWRD